MKIVLIVLATVILAAQGYVIYRDGQLARQGAETHAAVCEYKRDLATRAASSAAFLRLTPEQITARYGEAFTKIPRATIESSLHAQQAAYQSLHSLHC